MPLYVIEPKARPNAEIINRIKGSGQGLLGTIEDEGCVVRLLAYFDFRAINRDSFNAMVSPDCFP